MRGNLRWPWRRAATDRSIPACAGEPDAASSGDDEGKVYPRVCGGTGSFYLLAFFCEGLSPRVRGNPAIRPADHAGAGSIPACAGEPPGTGSDSDPIRVYPRVCGGTSVGSAAELHIQGLSPRVRGNRRTIVWYAWRRGSIPACAGEPRGGVAEGGTLGVYPRVCGGTRAGKPVPVEAGGLSPRVRGNPRREGRARRSRGSIPACAGEP